MNQAADSAYTREPGRTGVIASLAALYIIWSSTYLAIRIAIEGFPPFLMAGIRFFVVGIALYAYLRWKGAPAPRGLQWRAGAIVGGLLLLGGNGGVVFAEQSVSSGLAALGVATTPLWTVLFAGIWKRWPSRAEWAGIALGLVGIVLLNLESDFRASPAGAIALFIAAVSWALGSAWSRQLPLPAGMMASAVEMITGGALLLLTGAVAQERISALPSWRPVAAVVYLAVFGSLVGFSAFTHLINRVRPALATSYAYVNPALAVLLGVWLADERIGVMGLAAMFVILTGVVLVVLGQRR
ncbi:MAG TPA: drug/metabolite exporter YedA [Nitrospirota bacterium]|nr:drug/metabolite exporter YedA [Nitrospirota bacterium]